MRTEAPSNWKRKNPEAINIHNGHDYYYELVYAPAAFFSASRIYCVAQALFAVFIEYYVVIIFCFPKIMLASVR